MRQVVSLTSTYSSDEFGICSALFELGGLVVMHDASGCNSTYTTHDEPRWYDTDSMIYVSAISEVEAIMGDDEKLLRDLEETAGDLHPKFIAIIGAPIPYMIGTDLPAIAHLLEERTGIPAFGFPANGMNLYTKGISDALYALVDRFCLPAKDTENASETSDAPDLSAGRKKSLTGCSRKMNILGATPLDLPAKGCVPAIWAWAERFGFEKGASLSLETSLEEIVRAGEACVNLVVSYGGLAAARLLQKRFGTPYIVGIPFGTVFSEVLGRRLQEIYANAASRKDAENPLKEILRRAKDDRPSDSCENAASQKDRPSGSCENAASQKDRPSGSCENAASKKDRPSDSDEDAASKKDRPSDAGEDAASQAGRSSDSDENSISQKGSSSDSDENAASQKDRPFDSGGVSSYNNTVYSAVPRVSGDEPLLIIGESVFAASFAAAVELEQGIPTRVLCPVDTEDALLRPGDLRVESDDDLIGHLSKAKRIAADPLFRPLTPKTADFYDLPHTAFSGRIFEKTVPNRIAVPVREDFRKTPR